jgi:hypothetical protein
MFVGLSLGCGSDGRIGERPQVCRPLRGCFSFAQPGHGAGATLDGGRTRGCRQRAWTEAVYEGIAEQRAAGATATATAPAWERAGRWRLEARAEVQC